MSYESPSIDGWHFAAETLRDGAPLPRSAGRAARAAARDAARDAARASAWDAAWAAGWAAAAARDAAWAAREAQNAELERLLMKRFA